MNRSYWWHWPRINSCFAQEWFAPPAELPCNPTPVEVLSVQNPPALCLRDIYRNKILLWKLTKLLRTATSPCPVLLQMSNDRLLFILLNVHFSRAAFFPCLDRICGSFPTAFKRGWIHTQVLQAELEFCKILHNKHLHTHTKKKN